MVAKDLIIDFSDYDLNHVLADLEEIRRYNPQRHEMEQLTAIVYENVEREICVGYKDLPHDAFWTRGHMPGMPIMPGVLMCEAAGQLASFYVGRHKLMGPGTMLGFGGLEDVHFRGIVRPGDRLVIAAEAAKIRRGIMVICRFQCFVRQNMVCDGVIKGIALPVAMLMAEAQSAAS